jgi:antitoxin HicB
MRTAFAVRLERMGDGEIVVTCRDLPEVLTSGGSEAEALDMAEDALDVVVSAAMDEGRPVPEPSPARRGERLVSLPAQTAAKLSVWRAFLAAGISKSELARLGVGENEARRILSPRYRTKLDKLEAAARARGTRSLGDNGAG